MTPRRRSICFALVTTMASTSVMAQETDAHDAVREKLLHTFDKPESRLTLDAIVVSGDAAIADWEQGGMGGRALLRQRNGGWKIVLCSGDEIRTSEALARTGLAHAQAEELARLLSQAEKKLEPERLATLARFEGTVRMDSENDAAPHSR